MATQDDIFLSTTTTRVGSNLFWTVLPSAGLLGTGSASSKHQVKRALRDLQKRKLIEVHEMGCLLPPVTVISWTERGLDRFEANEWDRSWCGADGLGSLALNDFAKVEAVNGVAPLYATGGWVLQRIQFFERQPMIAAAEYSHPDQHAPAYLVFCWVSMLENQRELCERIEALDEAMQAVSMDPSQTFWPSGIALLAASEWGATRALCLARAVLDGWVEFDSIAGWYYGSGEWHVSDAVSALTGAPPGRMPPLLNEVRRLRPSFSVRKLGKRKLKNILARSLWAGRGGHKLVELLTLVALYPCGSVAHYQRLVSKKEGEADTEEQGEADTEEQGGANTKKRGGANTKKRLKHLEKMGLIEIVTKHGRARRSKGWAKDIPVTLSDKGQGAHRYATTLAGRVTFCYIHGGRPEDLFRRTKLGRLKTEIRGKVLLHLLNLSWIVHTLYAPGLRPADRKGLVALDRNWRKFRKGALVHILTLACIVQLNQAPGGTPADALSLAELARIWARLREDMVEDWWLYQHEDIGYEILGQLNDNGCAFAPGWQGWTTLADGRRIEPDAVIFVETPWGRLWCYLEVELSDRTYRAVLPRCDKYASEERRDDLPVLIVCRDDKAEGSFHLAADASKTPPRMLTTTLSRLKKGKMFGPEVWSDSGKLVTLAP